MAKQDAELLTMSRCRRLLEQRPAQERARIVAWLATVVTERAQNEAPVPAPVDPRQPELFD